MGRYEMKIPKFLNIFGLKVKIVIQALSNGVAGMYEHGPRKKTIYLHSEHETNEELMHTLLHECGHCLFYRVSINQGVSFEVHEFIVNNYATMLQENFWVIPKDKENLKSLLRSLDK